MCNVAARLAMRHVVVYARIGQFATCSRQLISFLNKQEKAAAHLSLRIKSRVESVHVT